MFGIASSLYFLSYGLIGLMALAVMYSAMKTVHDREGKPINYKLLQFVGMLTGVMFLGAGAAFVFYI